eukprot:32062_1
MSVGVVQMTFGNILPYIASYLAWKHKNNENGYNYYTDQGTWIYVARTSCFVLGGLFGAKVSKYIGEKATIFIGDIIFSVSFGVTYFTVSSLEWMIFTYGAMPAIGTAISYMLTLSVAAKWFPNNQAFVSGIILSGYGLSGVVFSVVFTAFINPNNIELNSDTGFLDQPQVLQNVQSAFWKMAIICFAMQIIGILLINEAPKLTDDEYNEYAQKIDCISQCSSEIDMTKMIKHKLSSKDEKSILLYTHIHTNSNRCNIDKYLAKFDLLVLKQPIFINIWLTVFFSQLTAVIFSTQWKTFTNQQLEITDDLALSFMGSFSSFSNALGRIFWGYVNDKKSYILTMTIMTLSDCALLASWPFLGDIFYDEQILTIFANVWLGGIFFFQVGIFNIMVRQVGKIYGVDKISFYYALLMSNGIPASIFSALAVVQMRQTMGWIAISYTMATFQFIAFCIVLLSNSVDNIRMQLI